MTERYQQLQHAWEDIQSRIQSAAQRSGRSAQEITAIAVTKTFPATDVEYLHRLGFQNFGENRVEELRDKSPAVTAQPLTWHMVGQLQTNKVNRAVRFADVFHSCDRPRLVSALARAAENQDKTVTVLIQVGLSADQGRGGIDPDRVLELAAEVVAAPALRLKGVMAMAPLDVEPDAAFARLQATSERLRGEHPHADWISAGMSNDFEAAIEHGATHIRLGRGLLGTRPVVG